VPAVSVIVPARDAAATLPRTLAALAAQVLDGGCEVIVVDDRSRDATVRIAREAGLGPVIGSDAPGPAAARNAGAAAAAGRILAFTDADCFPTEGWLAAGVAALAGGADLVQGAVAPDPDARPGPFDRTLWVDADRGLYQTANLFVGRELFGRLGGFESWLGPVAAKELAEDVLLGWAARRAGGVVAFAPEAVVHHAVHPRGARGFVAERLRLRFFPALVARIPELRRESCFAGVFLTRRSAAFDLALVGLAAAAAGRRAGPLAWGLPYLALSARDGVRWGPRLGPRVAVVGLAADAVGAGALALGSLRTGSPLL
jgi:glycosyltransferase involved in cell wall biosynthesis